MGHCRANVPTLHQLLSFMTSPYLRRRPILRAYFVIYVFVFEVLDSNIIFHNSCSDHGSWSGPGRLPSHRRKSNPSRGVRELEDIGEHKHKGEKIRPDHSAQPWFKGFLRSPYQEGTAIFLANGVEFFMCCKQLVLVLFSYKKMLLEKPVDWRIPTQRLRWHTPLLP